MNLYQVTAEYRQILEKDVLTDEDMKQLDQMNQSIELRLVSTAYAVKNTEHLIEAIECEIANMKNRIERLESNILRMEKYIDINMENSKMDVISKSPHFDIKRKINPPHVHVEEPTLIPEGYYKRKETYVLDKTLIRADIEKGISVPGAKMVRGVRIEIK